MKNLLIAALSLAGLSFPTAVGAQETPPSMALWGTSVPSNIVCRTKARSRFLELGGKDLSGTSDNAQWSSINGMKALVWCRSDNAVIAVSGSSYSAVSELLDEIKKVY